MSRNLDAIDQRILKELESDGRVSIVELSSRVNLTNTPCSERVKRLEREGYINGYQARLNMEMLGLGHLTVVQVTLAATGGDNSLDAFNSAVRNIPEVESCLMLAGQYDYLLTIRTRDMKQFRDDNIVRGHGDGHLVPLKFEAPPASAKSRRKRNMASRFASLLTTTNAIIRACNCWYPFHSKLPKFANIVVQAQSR